MYCDPGYLLIDEVVYKIRQMHTQSLDSMFLESHYQVFVKQQQFIP